MTATHTAHFAMASKTGSPNTNTVGDISAANTKYTVGLLRPTKNPLRPRPEVTLAVLNESQGLPELPTFYVNLAALFRDSAHRTGEKLLR